MYDFTNAVQYIPYHSSLASYLRCVLRIGLLTE